MKQTTIQNPDSILKGSVRVLVGDDFDSLVDVGAIRDAVLTSLAEIQNIAFDNTDPIKRRTNGKRVQFAFQLAEINFANLAVLNGGAMTRTVTAGSSTPVTAEAHGTGWTIGQPFRLENKDGDDSSVQSIVVKSGATTLTLGTDYAVYVGDGTNGAKGYTYIVPITAQAGVITVNYAYVPNASETLTFEDSGSLDYKVMLIVNQNGDGEEILMEIEEGVNVAPIVMDFAADDEDNVTTIPVTFEGNIRPITTEQGVA